MKNFYINNDIPLQYNADVINNICSHSKPTSTKLSNYQTKENEKLRMKNEELNQQIKCLKRNLAKTKQEKEILEFQLKQTNEINQHEHKIEKEPPLKRESSNNSITNQTHPDENKVIEVDKEVVIEDIEDEEPSVIKFSTAENIIID